MRSLSLVALAAGLAACQSATQPTQPDRIARQPTLELSAPDALGVRVTIEDVRTRLVEALDDQSARELLRGLVDKLSTALEARDASAARRALGNVRQALVAMDADALADPVLESIRFALDYTATVLSKDSDR